MLVQDDLRRLVQDGNQENASQLALEREARELLGDGLRRLVQDANQENRQVVEGIQADQKTCAEQLQVELRALALDVAGCQQNSNSDDIVRAASSKQIEGIAQEASRVGEQMRLEIGQESQARRLEQEGIVQEANRVAQQLQVQLQSEGEARQNLASDLTAAIQIQLQSESEARKGLAGDVTAAQVGMKEQQEALDLVRLDQSCGIKEQQAALDLVRQENAKMAATLEEVSKKVHWEKNARQDLQEDVRRQMAGLPDDLRRQMSGLLQVSTLEAEDSSQGAAANLKVAMEQERAARQAIAEDVSAGLQMFQSELSIQKQMFESISVEIASLATRVGIDEAAAPLSTAMGLDRIGVIEGAIQEL